MSLHHVLDDGQPKARAASVPRTAAVDSVEAFGQSGQVFARDTDSAIDDFELASAARGLVPTQRDLTPLRRVAHRVVEQVAHRTEQFRVAAGNLCAFATVQFDAVPPGRQRQGVCLRARHQRSHGDPTISSRPGAAFQLRQDEQVAHQGLHTRGLLIHQHQYALALGFGQGQLGQRLHEAGQHCQGGADLVRHVGDEVATHGLGTLPFRDVLDQHELHAVAIGPHQHRQRGSPQRTDKDDGLFETPRLEIGDEGRCADQVGHPLAAVSLGIQPEVLGCHRVAPFDLVCGIEQHHPVGRGFDSRKELLQAPLLLAVGSVLVVQGPLDPIAQFTPEARIARCRTELAVPKPVQQPVPPPRVQRQDHREGCDSTHHRAGSWHAPDRSQDPPQ